MGHWRIIGGNYLWTIGEHELKIFGGRLGGRLGGLLGDYWVNVTWKVQRKVICISTNTVSISCLKTKFQCFYVAISKLSNHIFLLWPIGKWWNFKSSFERSWKRFLYIVVFEHLASDVLFIWQEFKLHKIDKGRSKYFHHNFSCN